MNGIAGQMEEYVGKYTGGRGRVKQLEEGV
jgi:hypothetical protein